MGEFYETIEVLLLGLEADSIDDETFLRLSREMESYHYIVDRLLKLGRLDEALAEAKHVENYDRLYQKMGKSNEWTTYIADLRERNARLPALKDEIAKAKL